MAKHTIIAARSGTQNGMDWEAEYRIRFVSTKGSPDYYNKAGGHWEQGWPAEIEFVSVEPMQGVLDHGAFTDLAQKDLDDWASEWLAEEGYADAMEVVASDDADAREYAAELRADR